MYSITRFPASILKFMVLARAYAIYYGTVYYPIVHNSFRGKCLGKSIGISAYIAANITTSYAQEGWLTPDIWNIVPSYKINTIQTSLEIKPKQFDSVKPRCIS